MNQNEKNMSMCMEVAGIEAVEGLDIGPRTVRDGAGMRDTVQFGGNGQNRQASGGCEAYGMDTD